MRDRLLTRLDAFDRLRWGLLDQLDATSPEILAFVPAPGEWSILEVVEHLVRAEADVLRGTPPLHELVARPRGLTARLRYVFTNALLRSPISVGIPSAGMAPQGNVELAELRQTWDASQRWLRAYIASEKDLSRAVFVHPVTGPLDVASTIALNAVHIRRHLRQIDRVRTAAEAQVSA
ncbi:MAG: DinB family protein [Bacteroidota bacterium]